MNDLLAAAKAVIKRFNDWDCVHIDNLRAAVDRAEQEPEPEPVAWITPKGSLSRHACFIDCAPLYRHPPRQPVWLTDEEVKQVIRRTIPDVTVSESVTFRAIARAIKAAVLEKNQ